MSINSPDYFDEYLQLPISELEWECSSAKQFELTDINFLINPRRLRGSDFLMRWMQGRWSEDVVQRALNATAEFGVIPYGPSTVAPDDPNELEWFFEKMDVIAMEGKRPDLLLFHKDDYEWAVREISARLDSLDSVALTPSTEISDIISRAIAALEVENSLWVTAKMPGFGKPYKRYVRGKNKGRLKSSGPAPTIIVKQEDIARLSRWQSAYSVPITVVHIFYDKGYFVRFDDILSHITNGDIGFETQKFSNPDGTTSSAKEIVKVPYILCKEFGEVSEQGLEPRTFIDKNGKVMTYVTFTGGQVKLANDVYKTWLTQQ